MKPNFKAMTNAELRAYALEHRDEDIEALRMLFSRRKPDSQKAIFHLPKTKEEEQEQFELFKRLVEEKEGQQKSDS